MARKRRTREEMYPLYARYRSSGQTIETFCESAGINKHTFNYWRLKFIQSDVESNQAEPFGGFQQILPLPSSPSASIILRLGGDIEIILPTDYSPDSIGKIVKSVSC